MATAAMRPVAIAIPLWVVTEETIIPTIETAHTPITMRRMPLGLITPAKVPRVPSFADS